MKIYNTLTKRVEDFKPNVEGKVAMYGRTVMSSVCNPRAS